MAAPLPTPREFQLRSVGLTTVVSTAGVVLMALYLAALLRLSAEQWDAFVRAVAISFAVLFVAVFSLNRWLFQPVLRFLARPEAGAEGDARARAFRDIGSRDIRPGIERQRRGQSRVVVVEQATVLLARALGIVAHRLQPPGGFRPGAMQVAATEAFASLIAP